MKSKKKTQNKPRGQPAQHRPKKGMYNIWTVTPLDAAFLYLRPDQPAVAPPLVLYPPAPVNEVVEPLFPELARHWCPLVYADY